jgi:hypothetical protein
MNGLMHDLMHDEHVHYQDEAKISHAVAVITMTMSVVMIISPLWALQFVHEQTHRLATITMFIVLFISLVRITIVAKPVQILQAAAAYAHPHFPVELLLTSF